MIGSKKDNNQKREKFVQWAKKGNAPSFQAIPKASGYMTSVRADLAAGDTTVGLGP